MCWNSNILLEAFLDIELNCVPCASVCMQCRYWTRSRDPNCESERYNLYKYWARFLCFFKEQPLNLVRYNVKPEHV